MDELLGRAWWMLILRGTVALLFGILALFWPGLTLLLLVTLFSAYAIAGGIVAIGAAIRYRATLGGWWVPLLLGICSIGAGAIAVLVPGITNAAAQAPAQCVDAGANRSAVRAVRHFRAALSGRRRTRARVADRRVCVVHGGAAVRTRHHCACLAPRRPDRRATCTIASLDASLSGTRRLQDHTRGQPRAARIRRWNGSPVASSGPAAGLALAHLT
jgi:hypothetical protein